MHKFIEFVSEQLHTIVKISVPYALTNLKKMEIQCTSFDTHRTNSDEQTRFYLPLLKLCNVFNVPDAVQAHLAASMLLTYM